jgi:hypothetical protein
VTDLREILERAARRFDVGSRLTQAAAKLQKTPQAVALEARGYEPWAMTLGRRTFKSPFSPFHHRFWRWYWPARMKLLRGERLTADELTALLVWARGMGKSSHVEWACIAEGALGEGVTDEPGFVGYVCADSDLAKGHLQSIRNRLLSPEIAEFYPGLANPLIDAHGHQLGFRQDFLSTASGWGIIPIGLKEGVRGGRLLDQRFSMFVFDDVDNRKFSADVIRKNLEIIAYEILPAGTPGRTLNLFPQNLVRDDGALSQILNYETDVLARRTVIGDEDGEPLPAFTDVELIPDEERPGTHKIKSATVVWEGFDLAAAEIFLANSGKAAFLAEYQHDFTGNRAELVLQNWRDEVHVITRSQFGAVTVTRTIPFHWPTRGFNDWAKTNTAKHANVAGFLSVSPQGRDPRTSGLAFLHDCMSFDAGAGADKVALRIIKALAPVAMVNGKPKPWEEVLSDAHTRQGLSSYDLDDIVSKSRDSRSKIIPALVRPIVQRQKVTFRGSAEENNGALKIYRDVYGLDFVAANPGADGGVNLLNHLMLVDRSRPHLFKPDERGPDGQYKLGFSRFYLIVEDGKEVPIPKSAKPRDLYDSDRARYQLAKWRELPVKDTETGEVERGPEKRNDDFGNGLMMCTHDGLPVAPQLTPDERFWVEHPDCHPDRIAEDIAAGRRSPNAWHAADATRREYDEHRGKGTFASGVAARRYGKGAVSSVG